MTEKKSLVVHLAEKMNLEPDSFLKTVKATTMAGKDVSNEELAMFLHVADVRGLDPLAGEIQAFPKKDGGIQPIVGIDGYITMANRHPAYDGLDFEYERDNGKLISCTAIVWRKDRERPTKVTEFMEECVRPTHPWKQHPTRMLRHKAASQAIRYAFGFSGVIDEEEAREIQVQGVVVSDNDNDEIKKKLLTSARQQHNEEQQNTSKEPQPLTNGNGELIDWRRVPFNDEFHASTKRLNDDGSWRYKRGVDKIAAEQYEDRFLENKESETQKEEDSPETEKYDLTLESFYRMIKTAKTMEELDEVEDLLRDTTLPDKSIECVRMKIHRHRGDFATQEESQ